MTIQGGHIVSGTGGGILNDGTLTVGNCTLSGNNSVSDGGGIYNSYGGSLTVSASTLSGNSAEYGGGISNFGMVTVSNSTISSNSAEYGGGISDDGILTVSNSTISSNSAEYGGGLYNYYSSSSGVYGDPEMTVNDSTLWGNSAVNGGGGGICQGYAGYTKLNNTIVAGSVSGGDLYLYTGYGSTFSGGNDLIGDGSYLSSFTGSLQGNPLLAPLGNYGGPTQTMALLPGSPAIDAGSNTLAVDANGHSLTIDERSEPRIVGGAVDIGAFESQGFTISATGGNNQSAGVGTNFAGPLKVTVIAKNTEEPVNGGVITFTAPSSGASASLSPTSATVSGGSASVTATANNNVGTYTITASASGAATPTSFSLTNVKQGPPSFVVSDAGDYSQRGVGANPIDTNGGISLRSAIAAADADAALGVAATITFSPALNGHTITLTQGQLELKAGSVGITIKGGGQIAVSGKNQSGVFLVDPRAMVSIAGLTIEDGKSTSSGAIGNNGTLTVTNSTIAGNAASLGGGIDNTGKLTVLNSTIASNSAGSGGGIDNTGTLTVTNSTVADNSGSEGGGIANLSGGSATLNNTIVANSSSGSDLYGSAFAGAYDVIGDGSDLSSLSHSLRGNPLLAPLGNYGGPMQTMALLPGSPAVAAGSKALAVDGSGNQLNTDQRGAGFPRVINGSVDIGAYESQGVAGSS